MQNRYISDNVPGNDNDNSIFNNMRCIRGFPELSALHAQMALNRIN
jgi:hypothetical protein